MNKPYIFFPKPYHHYSGGVRALHFLCHYLNEAGERAYMTAYPLNPRLNTPYLDDVAARVMVDTEEAIVIYPERVKGNPYSAETVVRFLLHEPDYFDGSHLHGEDEIVVAFTEEVAPEGLESEKILNIPCIETDIFNQLSNYSERVGYLYYVGKGEYTGEEPVGSEELSVTNFKTREDVADALKRSKGLFLYDGYTLLDSEAKLCGCPVTYATGVEPFGFKLSSVVDHANKRYGEDREYFISNVLPAFIEYTQNYAKN